MSWHIHHCHDIVQSPLHQQGMLPLILISHGVVASIHVCNKLIKVIELINKVLRFTSIKKKYHSVWCMISMIKHILCHFNIIFYEFLNISVCWKSLKMENKKSTFLSFSLLLQLPWQLMKIFMPQHNSHLLPYFFVMFNINFYFPYNWTYF